MALMVLYGGNLHLTCPSYSPPGSVCWQPTAWETPKIRIVWPSLPCMLATYRTYSLGNTQNAQSYGTHGPVCWQPTAWETPKMPIIYLSWPSSLGNTQNAQSYGTHGPVCWQPTAWETTKMPIIWPLWPWMLATYRQEQPGKQRRCPWHSPHGPARQSTVTAIDTSTINHHFTLAINQLGQLYQHPI